MAISFNEIPRDIRVPGTYIEVDNSKALIGLTQLNYRILVIGQRLNIKEATVPAGVPTLITSKSHATAAFGEGSLIANMLHTVFNENPFTEKYAIALDDLPENNSKAATGTITVTTENPKGEVNGVINLYLGGERLPINVKPEYTQDKIAAKISEEINARKRFLVFSEIDPDKKNVVNVTFKHRGEVGNTFDMRLNYAGQSAGEFDLKGLKIEIKKLEGGMGNPDIANVFARLPDEIFNYWVMPYTDKISLDKIDEAMNDRWSPLRMLEGHTFVAAGGTPGELQELGIKRNNQHVTIMDAGKNNPTPPYTVAAATCARVAYSASIDPARPFGGLRMLEVLPSPMEDRRTLSERNSLLFSGISTHKIGADGSVQIERVITTYQKNQFNLPDPSYLEANTLFTLSYLRQTARARMTSRFPRSKLADDGVHSNASGTNVVTPSEIKAQLIALAGEWVEEGIIDDIESFKSKILVERNKNDRSRVDAVIYPTLVGQFHILAVQIAFNL